MTSLSGLDGMTSVLKNLLRQRISPEGGRGTGTGEGGEGRRRKKRGGRIESNYRVSSKML